MKICKHCGAENPEKLSTCSFCGSALEEEEKAGTGLLGSMGGKRYTGAEEKPAETEAPAAETPEEKKESAPPAGGLLGSMGKRRYESGDEKPAEKPVEKPVEKPEALREAGFAGSMGKRRYGARPKDALPEEAGFAGSMGKRRYGARPKDSPPEEMPREPRKKPADKGRIIAISLTVLALAASVLLVFWDAIFGSAKLYGAGIGGYINYYRPVEEEEIVEEDGVRYVGDQMVIVSGFGISYDEMEDFFQTQDMEIIGYVELIDAYQVQLSQSYTLTELHGMCRELEKDSHVDSASVNAVWESDNFAIPSDPWDGSANWAQADPGSANWGVVAIHAPESWERWEPAEVRVGVLDSMFDENHRDLNFAMTNGNEIYDRTPDNDSKAHGTHVSGTIGAVHDNGLVAAGVAENCRLYGYSASKYQTTMDEVSAMAELAAQDVRVINYSMGLIDEYRDAAIERNGVERDIYYHYAAAFSQTAMKHLLRKGYDFVLVCAAGNDPLDAVWASEYAYITDPQIRDRIIVVGAAQVDRDGQYSLAYFSARGDRMDVVAPGVDIYSTMPGGGGGYMSGTSMATPHVTGVTASVWAMAPGLSGAEVKRIVVSTANIPVKGSSVGMINMEAAMEAAEAAAR